MPIGIRFFKKAVSVINRRLAWRSACMIASGAKINSAPKTADIIPMTRIITWDLPCCNLCINYDENQFVVKPLKNGYNSPVHRLINLRKIKQKDNLLAVRNYYSKSDPGKDRILSRFFTRERALSLLKTIGGLTLITL